MPPSIDWLPSPRWSAGKRPLARCLRRGRGQVVEVEPSRAEDLQRGDGALATGVPTIRTGRFLRAGWGRGYQDRRGSFPRRSAPRTFGAEFFSGSDEAQADGPRPPIAGDRRARSAPHRRHRAVPGDPPAGGRGRAWPPVVVVVAQHEQQDSAGAGVTDWLIKPFSNAYARTKIRAWMLRTACR